MSKNALYTSSLSRLLKASLKSGRVFVTPDADGSFFVSDGRFILHLSAADYSTLILPLVKQLPAAPICLCGMGNTDGMPIESIRRCYPAADGLQPLRLTPVTVQGKSSPVAILCTADASVIVPVDTALLSIFADPAACSFAAASSLGPVQVDTPDGLRHAMMPVRLQDERLAAAAAACRALCDPSDVPASADLKDARRECARLQRQLEQAEQERDALRLQQMQAAQDVSPAADDIDYKRLYDGAASALQDAQRELSALRLQMGEAQSAADVVPAADLQAARQERDALRCELDALRLQQFAAAAAAPVAAPAAEAAPATLSDAEYAAQVKAAAEQLPGISCTINGSCYLWISGASIKQADALRALGLRWSPKRSAWYWSPTSCRRVAI